MGFEEILLALLFAITPIIIGWGIVVMNTNSRAAIILFALAPLPIIVADLMYVISTADGFPKRAIMSALIGSIALVAIVEQCRFILRNKPK
jgi:hypothetical protein